VLRTDKDYVMLQTEKDHLVPCTEDYILLRTEEYVVLLTKNM